MKKTIAKKKKKISAPHVSYSSITEFQNCRKRYYFSRILGYTYKYQQPQFAIGQFFHLGLNNIYAKKKNPIDRTLKVYKITLKMWEKKLMLPPTKREEFYRFEAILYGMLKAYAAKYKSFIKKTKLFGSEIEINYTTKQGTLFVGNVDNILIIKDKYYLHEVKTTKSLTMDYVKGIKTDLQAAFYMNAFNKSRKDIKISGLIYDVIMKPSIRLKKTETEQAFIERLYEYYMERSSHELFYMEKINRPVIKSSKLLSIIDGVQSDINVCKESGVYYENYKYCFIWGRCEFYDMCFNGENSTTTANFIKNKWR